MCPQACAGVRKRTCAGGSLQAPGLIMFWARVRKTAGPLEYEKNSPIRIPGKAAASPRSGQGGRRGHRRPGRSSALPVSRRAQRATGAAREAAETTAAGAVTFIARRDYELLEQVVSAYGR